MKRLINIQIRFLIGTIIMWFIGTVIFGMNLTVYGVANVIRWATYIQGAFLITTMIGWPRAVFGLLQEAIGWLFKIKKLYNTSTTTNVRKTVSSDFDEGEQFVLDIEKELCKNKVGETDKIKEFLLEIENSIRMQLPLGVEDKEVRIIIRKSMSNDEKIQFDALWMALDNIETSRMLLESGIPKQR